jgi:MarR family
VSDLELLELQPAQLKVFLAMRHLESRWGEVRATMETLGELTGYSRSSVHRAVESLVELGWVSVKRMKRNYGLWDENRYTLLRCGIRETSKANITVTETDAGRVIGDTTTGVLITTKSTNRVKSTSKLNKSLQEGSLVNNWKDDDDLGGFGLLEGETPSGASPAEKKKLHRAEKAIEKWSASDVASEFAVRVYAKVRGIPGLVNTKRLSIALAQNRKKFGVTAVQEMAALEKFFSDERNMATIRKFPKNSHGVFLNAITKYLAENVSVETAVAVETETVYVYASDGKQFDNSMPGRASLARYEEKLKG